MATLRSSGTGAAVAAVVGAVVTGASVVTTGAEVVGTPVTGALVEAFAENGALVNITIGDGLGTRVSG